MQHHLIPDEVLRAIRRHAEEVKKKPPKSTWVPPKPEDFTPAYTILCFDQTLSNCGWALLDVEADYTISVLDSGTIRPPDLSHRVQGFESIFAKSVGISREIRDLLKRMNGKHYRVVLELPSVVGYRTESSLVAAVTICVALGEMNELMPTFVSRQSAAAVLCGDRHASKSVSSQFVNEMVGDRHLTGRGQWTEHVRDAVFVGLRSLYREGV